MKGNWRRRGWSALLDRIGCMGDVAYESVRRDGDVGQTTEPFGSFFWREQWRDLLELAFEVGFKEGCDMSAFESEARCFEKGYRRSVLKL